MKFISNEVRYLRFDRLVSLLSIFGFTFTNAQFDCGNTVRVKGPGVPFLTSGTSECGDDWTAAGACMQRLIDLDLVPGVVIETLVGSDY
jgi:hypothetical protein